MPPKGERYYRHSRVLPLRSAPETWGTLPALASGTIGLMTEPLVVTDQTFDKTVGQGLVFVDFWAEWCGPCRMIAPIMKELAASYDGRIKIAKLDVDENPKTAMKYRVMSIPTVILFKDGEPVEVMVGAQPKRNFEMRLQKHLTTQA